MQSEFQRGLNMPAISNPKRAIYACNLFQLGPNMLANIENLFSRDLSRIIVTCLQDDFRYCKHIWSPWKKCKHIWSVLDLRLQPYLVPFEIQIVSILGPHSIMIESLLRPLGDHGCKHNWSLL